MRKINYKSDFKELVTLSGCGCIDVPFRFSYHCGSSCQPFVASWDGKDCYLNCRRLDKHHILVIFDRGTHSLGTGKLMCKREFFLNDSDFFDGICNFVSEECCETELTNGKTECDDFTITSTVLVNAIRGGSCLTEAEKERILNACDQIEKLAALNISMDTENHILHIGGKQYLLNEVISSERVEYSDIEVFLDYNDIAAEGGSVMPQITYQQTRTEYFSDGTSVTEVITEGGEITYSNGSTGKVTAAASTITTRHKIADVTATVVLNGKEGSATTGVYQLPYVEQTKYWVGAVSATKSGFAALTAEELDTASEERITSGSSLFSAVASCFFLVIPEGARLTKCSFTSGGMTTDILGNDAWNLVHEDIEIKGKNCKVYGYRNGGVTETDPQVYDYTIIKA